MTHAQGLELEFWMETMNMATYIKNWCPTKALNSTLPQEMWTNRRHDASHLKKFGCKAYAHIPNKKRNKIQSNPLYVSRLFWSNQTIFAWCVSSAKKIIKNQDVVCLERMNQIENVHDKACSKEVESVWMNLWMK